MRWVVVKPSWFSSGFVDIETHPSIAGLF